MYCEINLYEVIVVSCPIHSRLFHFCYEHLNTTEGKKLYELPAGIYSCLLTDIQN